MEGHVIIRLRSSFMTTILEVETEDRLRLLYLNRPDRKNALTDELAWAMINAVREAAHDDDVWAVAISGRGDAFCSGLDLGQDDGGPPTSPLSGQDRVLDDFGWVGHMALAIRVDCDKPVLAGINGAAVGAGLSLAMAADIRLASPSARFHPGYARVGTSPDGGLTWTLPHAIGYERAMRFLLEQRMIAAPEALQLGMVGEVAESDESFAERFVEYGRQLASVAPIAARQTKRLVSRIGMPNDLAAHLRDEVRSATRGLSTEDSAEAVRAMTNRESPTFRGR
jgi:2-(1,2-epoxy-1,2-dihydrophenyl)acetyl-CoA isomerase